MLHAQLGRFMQRDPMGYVDGLSLYQYVRSRPVIERDPNGLFPWGSVIRAIIPKPWPIFGEPGVDNYAIDCEAVRVDPSKCKDDCPNNDEKICKYKCFIATADQSEFPLPQDPEKVPAYERVPHWYDDGDGWPAEFDPSSDNRLLTRNWPDGRVDEVYTWQWAPREGARLKTKSVSCNAECPDLDGEGTGKDEKPWDNSFKKPPVTEDGVPDDPFGHL
jgi:hypothetical protein